MIGIVRGVLRENSNSPLKVLLEWPQGVPVGFVIAVRGEVAALTSSTMPGPCLS